MQTFRPDQVDLAASDGKDPFGSGGPPGPGKPVTRSSLHVEATDGGLRSGVWDSTAGTRDYYYYFDEWAYVLEGEAHVSVDGDEYVLRAGDAFYAAAGMRATWVVPEYVRKVWVHRRPPLRGRVERKLRRLLARGRSSAALGVSVLAGDPLELAQLSVLACAL
jgi:uncharacterized cupin superfamily protein